MADAPMDVGCAAGGPRRSGSSAAGQQALSLSIVVPVLDEARGIAEALARLAPWRARGVEVTVVDGGSRDDTVRIARPFADSVISAARGRATQMNAGARVTRGNVLLFLHADTRLPADADRIILTSLAWSGRAWGRFDVAIEGRNPVLPMIATLMNLRSRLTGIATGDQAMFMTRSAFIAAGGFPQIALMEDIALSTRLKRMSRPVCLRFLAVTSGRRWERHGVVRTILTMWGLRLAYFLGVAPARLANLYLDARER
jgi:rSAM/selenodomain-associated transferase 2